MKTILSPDRVYRYTLWREWEDDGPLFTPNSIVRAFEYLMVIGLNPSTADETKDDPTIRRCIDFAKRLGFGGLCMTNLFAYRATQPRRLLEVDDPVGQDNNEHLFQCAKDAGMVVAAWGKSVPLIQARADFVSALLAQVTELRCLRQNADGSPEHPLYIPAVTKPILFKEKINA